MSWAPSTILTRLGRHKRLIFGLFVLNLVWALVDGFSRGKFWDFLAFGEPCVFSLIFLPFSSSVLIAVLSKREALYVLGILSVLCLLGFFIWGMTLAVFLPLWVGLMFPTALRTWWSLIVTLGVLVFGFAVITPPIGATGQSARVANDLSNIYQIGFGILTYREEHNVFPDKLSQLQNEVSDLHRFSSPRGAGVINPWRESPLRVWLTESHPGPSKDIASWSEVDGGDYLYRKPQADAPANTIMIMTRPGLLYRNWVNVGFVDGHVETLKADVWKHRADVTEFLQQTGVQQE